MFFPKVSCKTLVAQHWWHCWTLNLQVQLLNYISSQENSRGTGTSLPAKEEVAAGLNELSGRYDVLRLLQLLSQSNNLLAEQLISVDNIIWSFISDALCWDLTWISKIPCKPTKNQKEKEQPNLTLLEKRLSHKQDHDFILLVKRGEKAACYISSQQQSVI